MQKSIDRLLIIVTMVAVALATIACGGGGEGASEPPRSKIDTPSTPTLSPADEPAEAAATASEKPTATEKVDTGQSASKQEAATFLEEYMEVFLDGKAAELPNYLSSTCSDEDVDTAMFVAMLANEMITGVAEEGEIEIEEVNVAVDADKLAVEIISSDEMIIAESQPEGTIAIVINGQSIPIDGDSADPREPIDLVREDGRWVTTACLGAAPNIFDD